MQIIYRPRDHWCCVDPPLRLDPAILRTCQKVHDEAAPVLYGKNAFYFSLPDSCTRVYLRKTEPAHELRLRSQCLWLFGYREHSWHTLFLEMQASLFARFLHRIGRKNAARLTTLRFLIENPDWGEYDAGLTVGQAVTVVMQLLKIHVSGLQDLGVFLMVHDLLPYQTWFLDDEKPVRPFRHSWTPYPPVESVVYDVLMHSEESLSGLKRLGFRGFDRDPYVKRELEKLEVRVFGDSSDENVKTRQANVIMQA